MADAYYFRAVAADGKLRTGTLTGGRREGGGARAAQAGADARLRRRRAEEARIELKLPSSLAARRRDVLFFTQELSTLLNAGVPLDRALSITGELTERAEFRISRASTCCAC